MQTLDCLVAEASTHDSRQSSRSLSLTLWLRSGLWGLVQSLSVGGIVVPWPLVAVDGMTLEVTLDQVSLQGHRAMALLSGGAPGSAWSVKCTWVCRGLAGRGWLITQGHALSVGSCWR